MSIDDFFWDSDVPASGVEVEVEFITHPHVPVVLLLDRSYSMTHHDNIGQLNDGVAQLKDSILRDKLASKRVDLCVISFSDDCRIERDFGSIQSFSPPRLQAEGRTAMGAAIQMGFETLRSRLSQYAREGVDCYRPWVILMTDGLPTDMRIGDTRWNETRKLITDGEKRRRFMFFSIGISSDALPALKALGAERPPLLLREDRFETMFDWLSASFSSMSRSTPGERVTGITNPTDAAHGWGDISA